MVKKVITDLDIMEIMMSHYGLLIIKLINSKLHFNNTLYTGVLSELKDVAILF